MFEISTGVIAVVLFILTPAVLVQNRIKKRKLRPEIISAYKNREPELDSHHELFNAKREMKDASNRYTDALHMEPYSKDTVAAARDDYDRANRHYEELRAEHEKELY